MASLDAARKKVEDRTRAIGNMSPDELIAPMKMESEEAIRKLLLGFIDDEVDQIVDDCAQVAKTVAWSILFSRSLKSVEVLLAQTLLLGYLMGHE